MAKKDKKMLSLQKLASIPPVLPVISDHPLEKETASQDKFDLCYRLGPIFDIIRHPKTVMPTTIAIYGDWGVGKTSAMQWLDALIGEWNKSKENADKTNVHTVWFYPWKYHDKEDVWRGLISEVILASINVKGADLPRVEKAAKQFGLFLGRSFLHVLGAVNEKAGSAVQKTIEEFNRVNQPEKAYLNEFESSLKEWTDETLGENDRMVIFIDDLDRCMPEIALQVLEALKLYLNIKKLIFVVGVDNNVIEPLVKAHYKELGIDDTFKSDKYLAKMFQTEVTIGPSERQVADYLDERLEQIEYFGKKYLTADEKSLFKELIEKFADRNPRQVKRLINSAVMAGAGAEMLKMAGREQVTISFRQGLQVFFIRKIVENPKTYNMPRLVGSNDSNEFFAKWSKIVSENRKRNFEFPCHIPSIKDSIQKAEEEENRNIPKQEKEVLEMFGRGGVSIELPSNVPEDYLELIMERRFRNLLHLLADENLGRLMQIEFSTEIAEITQQVEPQLFKESDEEIILKVIANELDKKPEDLKVEDIESLKLLDLHSHRIADINILKKLKNISKLNLSNNYINDIRSLNDLTCLKHLDISDNHINDINPLGDLIKLEWLSLHKNQIRDIKPLKGLVNLTELGCSMNPISNISPLKELTHLTELFLGNNKINDIMELKNLTKLEYLNIYGCPNITDDQVAELQKALPNLKIER